MIERSIAIIPAIILTHLTSASLFGATGIGVGQIWELTPNQVVWLQVAFVLGFALRAPVGLFVTKVVSDRLVFILAILISAAACFAFYYYAEDFLWGFVLRLIAGLVAGALVVPAINYLSIQNRGRASIVVGLACAAGWAASVYVSATTAVADLSGVVSFLPPGGGWSSIFLLSSIVTLIWVLPVVLFVRAPKR